MENSTKAIVAQIGVALTVASPLIANASTAPEAVTTSAEAKQQTLEELKQFELNKKAAMASLLQKLQANGVSGHEDEAQLLTKVAAAAAAALVNSKKEELGDQVAYLKPVQKNLL